MSKPTDLPWNRSLSIAATIALVRGWLLFVAVTVEHWLPLEFNSSSATINGRAVSDPPSLALQLSTWDAEHYLRIAEFGYEADSRTAAFYPLWPLLIRIGGQLTGDSLVAALVLANLLFAGAIALLHRWALLRGDPGTADRFVVLLAMYPGAVFFSLAYSESLFLLLTAAVLLSVDRRRWEVAALAALLLPMTRAVGLMSVLPLAWVAWNAQERRSWLLPAAPCLGFAGYLVSMQWMTGSPFTGFEAQAMFINRSTVSGLLDVPGVFSALVDIDGLHSVTGSAIDRLAFLLWLGTMPVLWKRDRFLFLWVAVLGWAAVAGVKFMAFIRYLAVLAPVFWVVSQALEPEHPDQPRTTWALVVAIFGITQVLFLLRYLSHYWVG